MDDSAIEDFIEKRLQSLTESLLGLMQRALAATVQTISLQTL